MHAPIWPDLSGRQPGAGSDNGATPKAVGPAPLTLRHRCCREVMAARGSFRWPPTPLHLEWPSLDFLGPAPRLGSTCQPDVPERHHVLDLPSVGAELSSSVGRSRSAGHQLAVAEPSNVTWPYQPSDSLTHQSSVPSSRQRCAMTRTSTLRGGSTRRAWPSGRAPLRSYVRLRPNAMDSASSRRCTGSVCHRSVT